MTSMTPVRVNIVYFAILREQRGVATESLVTDAPDAAALYEELRVRYNFSLPAANVRAAINGEFVEWITKLTDGDEVVFLPPVAGG